MKGSQSLIIPARWELGRRTDMETETLLLLAGSGLLCWLSSSCLRFHGQSPVPSLAVKQSLTSQFFPDSVYLFSCMECPLKTPALTIRVRVPSSCKDSSYVFPNRSTSPSSPSAGTCLTEGTVPCSPCVLSAPVKHATQMLKRF